MKLPRLLLQLGLLLGAGPVLWSEESQTDQAQAIAAIEKLGGKVEVDDKSPDRPVVKVDFRDAAITDAGLTHLQALTQLQRLHLMHTRSPTLGWRTSRR